MAGIEDLFGTYSDIPQDDLAILEQFRVAQPAPLSQVARQMPAPVQQMQAPAAPDDTIAQILSSRFRPNPSWSDIGSAAVQTMNTGKYVDPNTVAAQGLSGQLEMLNKISEYKKNLAQAANGGVGGGTGVLVNNYMKSMEEMGTPVTYAQALYDVQTGFRQGNQLTPTGAIAPRPGSLELKGKTKEAEARGSDVGHGIINPLEAKASGQTALGDVFDEMTKKIQKLDELKGMVSPRNTAQQNVIAAGRSSVPGQFIEKAIGTQQQTIRNDIAALEPVVINSIRQATGMSAKAMDSNAELNFYRQAVRAGDVQAQYNAIKRLYKLYGPGSGYVTPYEDTQAFEDGANTYNSEQRSAPISINFNELPD